VRDLLLRISDARPRVVLLDLGLRGAVHAITCVAALRDVDVVVLADGDDVLGQVAAVRAGATGVVAKALALEQLPRVLAAVLAGDLAIPRGLFPALLAEIRDRQPWSAGTHASDRLTERERQVLVLLAAGYSTSRVAAELVIAPVTVRSHVCALMRKLRLPDRESLIAYARERYGHVGRIGVPA
jgi:DNA-binding NarL/FixJ family response regulator